MSDTNKNVGGATAAGVIGAVIGAAAGAVAIALTDKKNREKVQKAANRLQKEGGKTLDDLKRMASKFLADTEKELEEIKSPKKLSKGK